MNTSWIKSRQAKFTAMTTVYILVVLGAVGVVNYLAKRFNTSYDATSTKKYTLSDQTIKVAKNLKNNIVISYWDQPSKFTAARDLLDRYKNLSTKIDVQYMDADKYTAQAIASGVKVMGSTFVTNRDGHEEAKSLTESEVTSALVRSLKGGKRTVCFVEGSGEHTLDDSSPSGYSQLKDTLEKDNYLTKKINLFEAEKIEIPSDCTLLVVGGPTKGYQPPVVEALKKYVEGGGRTLFMVDPPLKFGRPVDDNEGLAAMLTN